MAEIKPFRDHHNNKDIIPLRELLPLDVPFAINIDPANACNFRCTFCPTGDLDMLRTVGRPKGAMNFDLFRKIVDDIADMVAASGKRIEKLNLHKDGEPLINKKLAQMIAYAKAADIAVSVETTTNGSLLDEKRAVELVESGLDAIRISVEHVTAAGYKDVTLTYSNYEAIRRNVDFMYSYKNSVNSRLHVHCKMVDAGFSDEEKRKFFDDFSKICDSIHIDTLMGWSRSNEKDWMLGTEPETGAYGLSEIQDRQVCSEPFTKLAINFDGTVSVCCVDWSHSTVIGDTRRQSVGDIWRGAALQAFRRMHLAGRRSENKACADCHYMKGLPACSFIDNDAQRLMPLFGGPVGDAVP